MAGASVCVVSVAPEKISTELRMAHGIVEIDHLMCGVDSSQQAGEAFERMGFTVTPLSVIESMGLSNRCVLFPSVTPGAANYLELMGIGTRANVPARMQQALDGGQRVKSMVLATEDCQACHAALSAAGFAPPTPPIHLAREWVFGPGDVVHPAFTVLLPMPAPLGFNVCQHKTVPLYLRPAWTQHANGAIGLSSVIAYAKDPADMMAFYERLFGKAATRDAQGLAVVSPAQVALRVGDAATISQAFGGLAVTGDAPQFLGFGIQVRSIAVLRARLNFSGIPHIALGPHRVIVAAGEACGNVIEFAE